MAQRGFGLETQESVACPVEAAERHLGEVFNVGVAGGDTVVAVADSSVIHKGVEFVLDTIRSAERPLRVTFTNS